MEDKKKYIYYRINSNSNPNSNYYIIEIQNNEDFENLSNEKLLDLLLDEGFDKTDFNFITSIKYRFKENGNLKDLKEDILIPNDIYKIYIELTIIETIINTDQNDDIEDEYYQTNIDELKKEINKLSLDNYNKNNFNNKISKKNELSQGKKNLLRIYGINQNIYFKQNNNLINNNINENNNKIIENKKEISIFYLYSYPIDKINKNLVESVDNYSRGTMKIENNLDGSDLYDIKQKDKNALNNKEIDKEKNMDKNNDINDENINYNNLNNIYEENIYYVQMFLLYEKIKEANILVNLIFEPIYDNFDYLEKIPDILHMKVNSFTKKSNDKTKVYIDLELNKGNLDSHPLDKIINESENINISKIKLFIFSSQNIEFFEKSFEKITYNYIILINSSKIDENQENSFISELYELLLKAYTIEEAFNTTKKNKQINDDTIVKLLYKNNKEDNMNLIIDKNYLINKIDNKEKKINLNKNCLLTLDFIKFNYSEYKNYYKMMLNRDKEIKEYISLFTLNKNKVCVYGDEGVEKKKFVQKIGYYLYERKKFFDNIYYLELYSLDEISRNILKLKIEEILFNNHKDKDDENKEEFDSQKILIIIYFKFIIEKKNIKILEQIIGELNYNIYFIFVFTINEEIIIKYPSIKLEKLDKKDQIKLVKKCINPNKINENFKNFLNNNNNKLSYNDIYLRILYYNITNNYNIVELSNKKILESLLEYTDIKDINIKKILAYFSILKFGISKDIFKYLFEDKEILFIKEKLNYIIFSEKNENEEIYCLDNSYIENIINILIEKHEQDLLNYLTTIFKYYYFILRYLVNNSNFPYDIIMQFHSGIKNNFWNKPNDEYEEFMKTNPKTFFDDVLYSNNIYSLFNFKEKRYEKMVAKEKERKANETKNENIGCEETPNNLEIFEYIGQIPVYLCTLLHFKNSILYRNLILDFFLEFFHDSIESDIEYKIKLQIFK